VLSLRYEVQPFGIRVAIIQPAQVSTGFAAKIHKLPPEGSPYRERVVRFIARDEELIQTVPRPIEAAEKVVDVVLAARGRRESFAALHPGSTGLGASLCKTEPRAGADVPALSRRLGAWGGG
jgi:NAD(P)-dependent dehydrogenase (short-subunit alcohol dehydrogenase family)